MAIPPYDLEAQPLESGRYVIVWVNPVVRKKAEGMAELLELCRLEDYGGYELWLVRFCKGDDICRRWVHQFDLLTVPVFPRGDTAKAKGGILEN